MREILFRGKRTDNGEWVYGYLVYDKDRIPYIVKNVETYNCDEEDDLYATSWFQTIPKTIGQYTGLNDKYGNNIFEGDILRDYGNEIEDWVVSYEYGGFVGTFDNVCENLYEISDLEVIGTIHDGDNND